MDSGGGSTAATHLALLVEHGLVRACACRNCSAFGIGSNRRCGPLRRGRHAVEAGVEREHVVTRNARDVRGVAQVDLAARVDDLEEGLVRDGRELQAVGLGVAARCG